MNTQNQVQLKVEPINKKESKIKVRYILLAVFLTPFILYGLAVVLPETHSYEGGSVYSGDVYNWEIQHKEKVKDVIIAENAVFDKKVAACEDERTGAKKKLMANAFDSVTNKLSVDQIASLASKRDTDNCTQLATKDVAFNSGTPDKPETGDLIIPKAKTLAFLSEDTFAPPVSLPSPIIEIKKKDLGSWKITRYYTPVKGQKRYVNGSYSRDFAINCSGDCLGTADGYYLSDKDEYKVAACPPTMKFGTHLWIDGIGEVVCHDRGGAIKGHHLDVWAGIGDRGLDNFYGRPETSGQHNISLIL